MIDTPVAFFVNVTAPAFASTFAPAAPTVELPPTVSLPITVEELSVVAPAVSVFTAVVPPVAVKLPPIVALAVTDRLPPTDVLPALERVCALIPVPDALLFNSVMPLTVRLPLTNKSSPIMSPPTFKSPCMLSIATTGSNAPSETPSDCK